MGAIILQTKNHHGINVINDYFEGNPPFKNKKNRDDFPDAFIYQCVKDLIRKDVYEIHCITNDNNFGEALLKLNRVQVYKSINNFLKSETLASAIKAIKEELEWNETLAVLKPLMPSLSDEIKNRLEELYVDDVKYKYIEHAEIPSDNNEALIEGVYEAIDITIEWDELESIGPGIITLPFSITCEADLEFPVYHANAYTVPEGVQVSYGDHEADQFFEAYGNVTLLIDGIMSLEFESEKIVGTELPNIKNLQIEEIKIHVVEKGEDGSIF
jgi:hypothetical protein